MSPAGQPKDYSLAQQLKDKPGKAIALGLILLVALWVWGRSFFAGEESRPYIDIGGSATTVSATGASAPPLGPIEDFETAMRRLEAWRDPLNPPPPPPPPVPPPPDLKLTSTIQFGKSWIAVIDGRHVKVGDKIGRYELKAIRNEAVDVFDGLNVTTIRIPRTKLPGSRAENQDQFKQ